MDNKNKHRVRSQFWVGRFRTDEAFRDFFAEREDDPLAELPISEFAGSQGEQWLDHDFIETGFEDSERTLEEKFEASSWATFWIPFVAGEVEKRDLGPINAFAMVNCDNGRDGAFRARVSNPSDVHVERAELFYLGEFEHSDGYSDADIAALVAAAEGGDAPSQARLGRMYIFPPQVRQDIKDIDKAEYWLLRAASAGQTQTYNRLYHLYAGRYGLDEPEKAFYWLEKASADGIAADLSYLSRMYASGRGTVKDPVQALKYAFLSKCGYETNQYDTELHALMKSMSAHDIGSAEALALEWIETTGKTAKFFQGYVRNPIRDGKQPND